MFLGERLLAYVSDYKGIVIFMPVTLILSYIYKVPGLDTNSVYLTFCLVMALLGLMETNISLIQESRTIPQLQAMSLEINWCMACAVTSFAPAVAKMAEPVPTIAFWAFGSLKLLMVAMIGPKSEQKANPVSSLEASINNLLATSSLSASKRTSSNRSSNVVNRW